MQRSLSLKEHYCEGEVFAEVGAMRDRRRAGDGESFSDSSSSAPRRSARRPPKAPQRKLDMKEKKEKCCCKSSRTAAVIWVVLAALLVGALSFSVYWAAAKASPKPRAVTPFPGNLVTDLPQVRSSH